MQQCKPGDKEPCYGGAPETKGVGLCLGGNKTCNQDGSGFGSCEGEILPKPEDCTTKDDEDCNGYDCIQSLWSSAIATTGDDRAGGVAVDGNGNVYVSAAVAGKVDFGGGISAGGAGGTDVLVVKYVPDPQNKGKYQVEWAKSFGTGGNEAVGGLAVGPNQEVYVGGFLAAGATIGNTGLQGGLFAAKLDGSAVGKGAALWAVQLSTGTGGEVRSTAVAPSGSAVFCGHCNTNLLGDTAGFGGGMDAFCVRLHPMAGQKQDRLLWSSSGDDSTQGVTVGPDDTIYATGYYSGAISFSEKVTHAGGRDAFVVAYDPLDKLFDFVKIAGDKNDQLGRSLAIAPSIDSPMDKKKWDVVATGYMAGTVNFGGGDLLANANNGNVFVVRYTQGGGFKHADTFGNAGYVQHAYAIAAHGSGAIHVAGYVDGATSFGGAPVVGGTGGEDQFILRLDAALKPVHARGFGSLQHDNVQGIAVTPDGFPIIVGYAGGTIDYGGGALAGKGSYDVVIAKFAP
jgi:hypothetical protein